MERETLTLRGVLAMAAIACMLALGSMLWLGAPAPISRLESLTANHSMPACTPDTATRCDAARG